MMRCRTCRLAMRLPFAFCSKGSDTLLYTHSCSCLPAYVWVFGVCVKAATSTRLQVESILPSPRNIKVLDVFTAWLTSGREKYFYRVLVWRSWNPPISDLILLRSPNIDWLFLSLLDLFDSWQKWVQREGKWVAAKSGFKSSGTVKHEQKARSFICTESLTLCGNGDILGTFDSLRVKSVFVPLVYSDVNLSYTMVFIVSIKEIEWLTRF